MPIKVFQKGHIVSDETRRKISKAFEHLNDRVNALIDYLKARENNDSHS